MSRGIRLHKEFGLNPTISKCVICGKGKNEIALLGAKYKGQAPMHMVTSPEPCAKCRKKYLAQGTMMLNPQTGSLTVLKDKAFKKMFNVPIPKGKIAFAEEEVLSKLMQMTGRKPKRRKKK